MFKFMLFVYLLKNNICQVHSEKNNSLICIVNSDDPAIFLNSTNPKAQHVTSMFQNRITVKNLENSNETFGNWKIISSINPQIKLKPIIDYRWENLPVIDENSNGLMLSVPNIVAFSVQLKKERSLLNLIANGTYYKILVSSIENEISDENICVLKSKLFNWCHFQVSVNKHKIQVESLDGQQCENNMETFTDIIFHFDNKSNVWKLHKYNYLWTNVTDNFHYSIKSNLSCITITVAMCQKCNLFIKVIDNYQKKSVVEKKITTNGQWETTEICLETTNFNLTLTTNSPLLSGVFWAIDDIIHTSKSDKRTLRYDLQENETANCEFITEKIMKCTDKSGDVCCGLCNAENNSKSTGNEENDANFINLNYLFLLIVPLITLIAIGIYLILRKKHESNTEEIQKPTETTGLTTPDWLFKEPEYND